MTVFQFESSKDYFDYLIKNWKGRKKPLTLRQFSELLGYKSPRSIAMVLKGQRSPSQEMITQIAELNLKIKNANHHSRLPKKLSN